MKRDLNLIRDLLLFYESDCSIEYPSADEEAIRQHLCELVEAGFLDGYIESGAVGEPQYAIPNDGRIVNNSGVQYDMFPITSRGHDFIANMRNDKVWKSVVKSLGSRIATVPLTMINDYVELGAKDLIDRFWKFVTQN